MMTRLRSHSAQLSWNELMDAVDTIKASLADSLREARAQGYMGTDEDYDFTAFDIDAVIRDLGRVPTRAEWAKVGLPGAAPYAKE